MTPSEVETLVEGIRNHGWDIDTARLWIDVSSREVCDCRAARKETAEQCAKIADEFVTVAKCFNGNDYQDGYRQAAKGIGYAIRESAERMSGERASETETQPARCDEPLAEAERQLLAAATDAYVMLSRTTQGSQLALRLMAVVGRYRFLRESEKGT